MTTAQRSRLVTTSTAFDPSSVAGLKAWFKADGTRWTDSARTTSATADGDRIGSWDDASGNGNHAKQATAGSRPTLKTGIQNGLPAIRFDGSASQLATAAWAALSQPTTILVVGTMTNSAPYFYDGLDTSNRNALLHDNSSGKIAMYGGSSIITSTVAPPLAVGVWTVLFNGASSVMRRDGTQVASGNPGSNQLTGLSIGSRFSVSNWLAGDLFEILVYTGDKTSNFAALESYLKTRWGTP